MKRARIAKIAVILFIIEAIIIGAVYVLFFQKTAITNDVSKMLQQARDFRAAKDYEHAYAQMQLYIQSIPDAYEPCKELAQWYYEDGNIESADRFNAMAVSLYSCDDSLLTAASGTRAINLCTDDLYIEINPIANYTKNITLTFYPENLAPKERKNGKINSSLEELETNENCRTTDWFWVDSSYGYLTLSGGMNCAIWQFKNADGIITSRSSDEVYHYEKSVSINNLSYSTITVPENSVMARVTYYDSSIEASLDSDDQISIVYGKIPSGYAALDDQKFEFPNITEGESIIYQEHHWYIKSAEGMSGLELDTINADFIGKVAISGDICGYAVISGTTDSAEPAKEKIYGIKYQTDSSDPSCIRTGHAVGMNFDYKIGDEWVNGTGNSFDSAYPWCDMKLCNISTDSTGNHKIIYEGDSSFATDGSNGNVMVEIPKFYVKRSVADGWETIELSGTKHEGFVLEPVFLKQDGSEAEHVYIAAYLGTENGDRIVSASGNYATLCMPYGETLQKAEANGDGYSELDFLMISAIQKLFIVETATLDSTSIFEGDIEKLYYYPETEAVAAESADKTNTIVLNNTAYTRKLAIGSSIILFSGWEQYSNAATPHREITKMVRNGNGTLSVTFDGEPIDIVKGITAISNVPEKTGKTDSIDYCSGKPVGTSGKVSFKYRGIENLYGSALVMLNRSSYVQNGYFTYSTADGETHTISQKVAVQPQDLTDYSTANYSMCIKEMSFDKQAPTIMIPTVVGNGASAFSGYCDYWMYAPKQNDSCAYLLYGGADDNGRLAGIFQMRAVIGSDTASSAFYSSRIMYRE